MFERNGRWYDAQGQVFIGLTETEALDMGLYPSVTTILNLIRRPALDRWLHTQVAKAAQIIHRSDYPSESEWVRAVEREADAEAFKARQRGLQAHGNLKDIVEQVYPPGSFMLTEAPPPRVCKTYKFGGSADGILEFPNEPPFLLELKTTSKTPPMIYREHLLQLGAYTYLYQIPRATLIVSTPQRHVYTREFSPDELSPLATTFCLLASLWWAYNSVHPITLGSE